MVGSVEHRNVLDIACGEGYFARLFAKSGAEVTAIDISEAMIEAAKKEEERDSLGIRYLVADAASLNMLESESFDISLCYMALMDIPDYEATIAEVSRLLKRGGRFIILIPHPCFGTRVMDERMVAGWEERLREDGSEEYLYCQVGDYFQRHSFAIEWRKSDRLPSSFVTTSFHRTLSDYVNALTKYGLAVTRLDEPQPIEEGVRVHPSLKKCYRVPESLVIEATKVVR